jgi:hypothetical protein
MLPILLITTRSDDTLVTLLSDMTQFSLEVVSDIDALTARCRDTDLRETPAAIVVDLHLESPGPVAPVVRALRRPTG